MEHKRERRLLKKENILPLTLIVSLLGLVAVMCVDLVPVLINVVQHVDDEAELTSYMQAYGGKGIPIIVALQALQVITTVFPAVAVQVLAGLSYGIVLGTILCCIGYLVGNAIVFIIIRQFHKAFAPFLKRERAVEERTEKKGKWNLSFLSETKNIERVTFLLFLIPGLPNGFLPYIFARTKVPLFNYLRSIALASIPAIAVCALAGQRFSKGDSKTGLIVLGVILALAIIVFFFRDRVMKFVERESKTEPRVHERDK